MPAVRKSPPPPPSPEDIFSDGVDAGESPLPESEKRVRTPKFRKLEEAISGIYLMLGGAATTLPEQIGGTRVNMIGMNLALQSDKIAEAWVDLAEDDKRVLKILEQFTSFSGWGKVIGVHLLVVGASVPGIAAAIPQMPQPQPQQQQQNGGMDLQTQMMMAEIFRMAQSQERAGQAAAQAEPVPPQAPVQQQQFEQEQAPRVRRQQPVTRPGRNAGIPSAADLGVSIPDAPVEFPTAGSDNLNK